MGDLKAIKMFSHFRGLIPDTNYECLECFITLGTHSQLRGGQILHIRDLNSLSVNVILIHTCMYS